MISYRAAWPLLRRFDPETAHSLALCALRLGLVETGHEADDPLLAVRLWNLSFPNPVGLSAGFDKDAKVLDALLALGFGFVEAGTVTPRPQPGNPKPRLFRLDEDEAVINRLGFNSEGLTPFAERLARHRARPRARGIVGANVGKNRDTAEAARDYVICIERVCRLADYLVVNLSSPNTPGLRGLQARAQMEELLKQVLEARDRALADAAGRPPLLAKVGPDLDAHQLEDIAEVALAAGVDGLVISNTTVDRPASLRSRWRNEQGGLSGRPLAPKSLACLSEMYRLTRGRLPIIGSGGISSGADAFQRIRAGASLVQMYSALVFHGPALVGQVTRELAHLVRASGFTSVMQAVGVDVPG